MADTNPSSTKAPAHMWPLFLILSGFLILRFAWAVAIPGGGWPLSPVHYMAMAADAGMTLGVIGVRSQVLGGTDDDRRRRTVNILFPLALISGAGLLLIRFTSDAAWWTGHLMN